MKEKIMESRLSDLKNGEKGVVISIGVIQDKGDSGRKGRGWKFRKRLEDMGLTPGTEVTMVKSAPFNGPLEVCARGSKLAIGRGMAERIFVEAKK
jgi:Fe2+ transport system protein FeoA